MAANPLEHVIDSDHWVLFESLGWEFHIPALGRVTITKYMLLELLAAALIILIFVPIARRAKDGEPPKGVFWNMFESLLTFIRDQVAKPCIGHDYDKFVPFLWTLFLFILFCNLLGLFPFLGSPTASISVTAGLAIIAFFAIHASAIAEMGPVHYLKSYLPHIGGPVWMSLPLALGIAAIEAVGHLIKAFVLAVRLFANMFAGHTVLAMILLFIVMAREASLFISVPITIGSVLGVTALSLLELFVAFLQAYIFVFLTALFIGSTLHPAH